MTSGKYGTSDPAGAVSVGTALARWRDWAGAWILGNAPLWAGGYPFPLLLPLVVGLGQWLLLRRLLGSLSAWWIPLTALGGAIGIATFATPVDWYPTGLFAPTRLAVGALAGVIVGGVQAPLLHRWRRGAAWVAGSGLGMLFLWPVDRGIIERASDLFGVRFAPVGGYGPVTVWTIALWLLQGCACGALYALPLAWVALRAARLDVATGMQRRYGKRRVAN